MISFPGNTDILVNHIPVSFGCGTDGMVTKVTAKGNDNLKNKCIGRYHFSAISALAALRYQCGMASFRMENMSDSTGIKVSDSTQ